MSIAVLSPMSHPTTTRDIEDDDQLMMNLFESAPSFSQDEPLKDDASVPSLSDDDVDMEDAEETLVTGYGGLRNLGNTCYLNSATQMLASLDRFTPALEAEHPVTDDASKLKLRAEFLNVMQSLREGKTISPDAFKQAVDERSSLFVGYRQQDAHEFLTSLLDLLDEAYQPTMAAPNSQGDSSNNTQNDIKVQPTSSEHSAVEADEDESCDDSCDKLSSLPSFSELKVDEISQLLHGDDTIPAVNLANRKEQSQCKLVGGRAVVTNSSGPQLFEASVVSAPSLPQVPPRAPTNQAIVSPIDDCFATEVRSRLVCDSCKYTRSQTEKYLHLSIEIGNENASVEEGLRKFFAPEQRDIKCEKCFCESATQTTEITKLPPALLLHFKRFIVDVSPDYSSITYRKNTSSVDFSQPLSLDMDNVLREFVADDATVSPGSTYAVRSIVNHIGSSASCGHYTADANRLYATRGWTRFNDSIVTRISDEEAMGKSRNAYMIMYELE